MNTPHSNTDCPDVQILLSEYIENSLSARQVWEVEKHLADCADCSTQLRQLQATVQLLQAAPRFDTGHDFMASLHARLDGLEPQPTPAHSLLDGLRDWLSGLGAALQQNRLPAFSVGLAAVALVLMFAVHRPDAPMPPTPGPVVHTPAAIMENTLPSVAAESANNPFADTAADTLEDRAAWKDTAANADSAHLPANL